MKLIGKQVYIRPLSTDDVTDEYVAWMNDPEVTQFLESRWQTYTKSDLIEYITSLKNDKSNFLFGIFQLDDNSHIGNIKIGNINYIHRNADIGMAIGLKTNWSKGVGSEVLNLVANVAFEYLNLNKIFGGIYAINQGSFKMTLKCGWREVGVYKKHVFYKGEYMDVILVEKLKE